MGKYLKLANLIVVLSILLTACAPAAVPSEAPQEAAASEADSTDSARPADMAETQEITVGRVFYFAGHINEAAWYDGTNVLGGGLLERHPDGSIRPWAADSWDVSDDGTVYTFNLNPDLKWCTGEQITAQDIKWGWEWLNIRFKWAKDYAWYMVEGIEEFLEATADVGPWEFDQWGDAEISGLVALDDHTLQVRLKGLTPAFIDVTSSGVLGTWGLLDPAQIRLGTAEAPWHEHPDYCGGFGPFMVEAYDPEEDVSVLVPNPHYVLGPQPLLDKITLKSIQDRQTQLVLYESGELDIAMPSTADFAQFTSDPNHPLSDHVQGFGLAGLQWLEFDVSAEPTNDPKIREAIYYSIDLDLIHETVYRNLRRRATGIIPSGPFYREDRPAYWQADPERARQAVADSTYGSAENVPPILYWSRYPDPEWPQLAQAVQQMVKDATGLEIQITVASSMEATERVKFQIWEDSYGTFSLDAQAWGSYNFASDSFIATRHTHWGDEHTDSLLAEIESNPNEAERIEAWTEFEDIVFGEYWMIPLYWPTGRFLVKPNVKGVAFDPTFRWINAEYMYVAEE